MQNWEDMTLAELNTTRNLISLDSETLQKSIISRTNSRKYETKNNKHFFGITNPTLENQIRQVIFINILLSLRKSKDVKT